MNRIAATMIAAGTFSAGAQETVTVTTFYDVCDSNLATAVPSDLPGPGGVASFREAVAATNNAPEPQIVKFAIPQAEWWILDDLALLELRDGPFVITDDFTTLDFASQGTLKAIRIPMAVKSSTQAGDQSGDGVRAPIDPQHGSATTTLAATGSEPRLYTQGTCGSA
ncbi:MAG TPA: hypothetical protein ENJ00_00535 [Phycisphaerales bacterium]|nr:hypothetical protein [Phycisphaerales bacterium]